jgi:hypothetical protein
LAIARQHVASDIDTSTRWIRQEADPMATTDRSYPQYELDPPLEPFPEAQATPTERVKTKPIKPKKTAVEANYDQAAMRASEIAALAVWLGLWLIDGYFTASFLTRFFAVATAFGWATHIAISLVQRHFWRTGLRQSWMLVIPLSTFNITTSVVGLWAFFAARVTPRDFAIFDIATIKAPQSVVLFWGLAIFGIFIAVWAEREMTRLALRIYQNWR